MRICKGTACAAPRLCKCNNAAYAALHGCMCIYTGTVFTAPHMCTWSESPTLLRPDGSDEHSWQGYARASHLAAPANSSASLGFTT